MGHWRLVANHTHLYPGARLRIVERAPNSRNRHDALVEFADGELAEGTLTSNADAPVLQLEAYQTRRKTSISAATWTLVYVEPDVLKVQSGGSQAEESE